MIIFQTCDLFRYYLCCTLPFLIIINMCLFSAAHCTKYQRNFNTFKIKSLSDSLSSSSLLKSTFFALNLYLAVSNEKYQTLSSSWKESDNYNALCKYYS